MLFVTGFQKIAAFTQHSDGSEFKITDTEPAPYAAGTTPPAHQATFRYQDSKETETAGRLSAAHAARKLLKKHAQSSLTGALDYVGTQSDAADTLASQLKWETTSGDEISQNPVYNTGKNRPHRVRDKKRGHKHE